LEDFVGAETWAKTRQILDKQEGLLLRPIAISLIGEAINKVSNDPGTVRELRQRKQLLENACIWGITTTMNYFRHRPDPEIINFALNTYLEAKSEEEAQQVCYVYLSDLVTRKGIDALRARLKERRANPEAPGPSIKLMEVRLHELISAFSRWKGLENLFEENLPPVIQLIRQSKRAETEEERMEVTKEWARGMFYADELFTDLDIPAGFREQVNEIARQKQTSPQRISLINTLLEQIDRDKNWRMWVTLHIDRAQCLLFNPLGDHYQNLEDALLDLNRTLTVCTRENMPTHWASIMINRGAVYLRRVAGNRQENIKQALADLNAALTIFVREQFPEKWVEVMVNRGSAYMERLVGDPKENIEQAINDFNAALTIRTRGKSPTEWASTVVNLANAYVRRHERVAEIADVHEQNLENAIANYDRALSVLTREDYPEEWATAISNRGKVYMMRTTGYSHQHSTQDLLQALADLDAALIVQTIETRPHAHRNQQFDRATIFVRLGRWEEAHAAYVAARAAQRDMLNIVTSEQSRIALIKDEVGKHLYLNHAKIVLQMKPSNPAEAVVALEEGYAQNMRVALDLDSLDLDLIKDPAAHTRAQTFISARDAWRKAQNAMAQALPMESDPGDMLIIREQRSLNLQVSHAAFLQARDAIRQYDNADFLAPLATIDDIARAITSTDEALIYLTTSIITLLFVVTRDKHGTPQVQHIEIPRFLETFMSLTLSSTFSSALLAATNESRTISWPTGGLLIAQLGMSLEFIREWGVSMHDAVAHLPHNSGFVTAATQLYEAWAGDSHTHSNLKLFETPFSALKKTELAILENHLNDTLMRIELEKALNELGQAGISQLAKLLYSQGIRKVSFVLYGPPGLLPISSVLVTLDDNKRYRLRDLFEITVTPGARALQVAKQRAIEADKRRKLPIKEQKRPLIVAAGDPQPLPLGIRGLKYAQAEADSVFHISEKYGYSPEVIRCLLLDQATKPKVVDALQQAWYAHLAMHGQNIQEFPRQSRLLLAHGETITLSECLDHSISLIGMRLLILSACETSVLAIMEMTETLGMAAGFMQAGAAGVIATLWPVYDHATYLLMSRFTNLYLDPQRNWSPARCLAAAQHWLQREATNAVLATYEPTVPVPLLPTHTTGQPTYIETQDATDLTESGKRSLRLNQEGALAKIHAKAIRGDPTALPYSHPIYWAAFIVMGC
ncbi:MAG TPA: CHAT domain-containing protein, partial [Ktedonobacteraceae bacterium]